jgi:hypothetical protein
VPAGDTTNGCLICGDPKHPQAYACNRCRKILNRAEMRRDSEGKLRKPDRDARICALKRAWDADERCFLCHYTRIPLDTEDHRDHRYLSLEHQTPGNETDIVVVSALINRMKTDLSDAEFKRMVTALAASFEKPPFDRDAFPDRDFRSNRGLDKPEETPL